MRHPKTSLSLLLILLLVGLPGYAQRRKGNQSAVVVAYDTTAIVADTLLVDSLEVNSILSAPLPKNDSLYVSTFVPDPMKALWYSVLFPGLGQIYNRKYWKLPILYGGFIGLTYAITWNSSKYSEYSLAYRDITGNDPNAKSYMDFFPPGTKEEDIDKPNLTQQLKRKKDYFRNNRDLSLLFVILVYGLGVLDAYVDASLFHFDMSPNLSMKMEPAVIQGSNRVTDLALGLNLSIRF